jgi:hypothetical protein
MSEEQRRLTYLRENVEHLAEEKNTLESLIWNLRNSADTEAAEILRRLRNGTDPVTLNQHIQAGRSLAQVRRDIPPDAGVGCMFPSKSWLMMLNESIDAPNLLSQGMQASQYEAVVNAIVTSTQPEVDEIVRKLRHHENIDSVLNSVRAGPFLQPLAERDVDMHVGIEGDYSSREHVFGLTQFGSRNLGPTDVQLGRAPEAHTPLSQTWTSVTDDQEFIDHLISIYFTWQHSFFQNFPEKLFREDMAAGRTRYCSKVLVNAVCAAGSLLSPRPEARRDPNDASTADIGFFDEAIRLLRETQVSSIPTVAALFLLCHVECYRGHLGLVWNFCGQSVRMALDLNLHLRSDKTPSDDLSSETKIEERARMHAFWGCFIADQ